MTNRTEVYEFYKKVKEKKFLSFKAKFLNLVIY